MAQCSDGLVYAAEVLQADREVVTAAMEHEASRDRVKYYAPYELRAELAEKADSEPEIVASDVANENEPAAEAADEPAAEPESESVPSPRAKIEAASWAAEQAAADAVVAKVQEVCEREVAEEAAQTAAAIEAAQAEEAAEAEAATVAEEAVEVTEKVAVEAAAAMKLAKEEEKQSRFDLVAAEEVAAKATAAVEEAALQVTVEEEAAALAAEVEHDRRALMLKQPSWESTTAPKLPAIIHSQTRNGVFKVKVIEAKDLKQMDTVGKNDAYCIVAVGHSSKRTSTITGKMYGKGRKDPWWNDGKGEALEWEVSEVPSVVQVSAWDEDAGSDDDKIGGGSVEIGEADRSKLSAGVDASLDMWCDLVGGGGKACGRVHVVISWKFL